MIEKPSDDAEELSPTHILYWLQEANTLKHTADLCWAADADMLKRTREAKLLGVGQSLLQSAQDAEAELNWLYRILVSFAIQHMAIGLLIDRDVHRFQKEAPGYRIVALLEECGFSVNALQKDILSSVENAFQWDNRHPNWHVKLHSGELRTLKRASFERDALSKTHKKQLDELYETLKETAEKVAAQHAEDKGR